MTHVLRLTPVKPFSATIRPPGSKSITNRAFLCAALADGTSTLHDVLDCRDTRLMADALRELGVMVDVDWHARRAVITGCRGQFPNSAAELYVENSGTTMRFLTAAVSVGTGKFRIVGSERMHQRPIGDLVEALRQLGVNARAESPHHCPPVAIESAGWNARNVEIAADTSSQFASGLMLAAPYSTQPLSLRLGGAVISRPYLELTASVMRQFGAEAQLRGNQIEVSNRSQYRGREFFVEPDASAASYFLTAAAITGSSVTIDGLGTKSIQGDLQYAHCLQRMGCRVKWEDDRVELQGQAMQGIDVDMSGFSDTVPSLAVAALFAEGPTTIRNVAHIRHKESDRIADLARELTRAGAAVDVRSDGLRITPGQLQGGSLQTYDDHRLAMSLALIGLRIPGIEIQDPDCVAKTYPKYFDDLASVTGTQTTVADHR